MRLSKRQIATIREYFRSKPIRKAYVFGSYARGEANEMSDIDLMVELEPDAKMGFSFFGLAPDLMEKLGKKVDLTTVDGFSPYVVENVMKDRELIYDREGA